MVDQSNRNKYPTNRHAEGFCIRTQPDSPRAHRQHKCKKQYGTRKVALYTVKKSTTIYGLGWGGLWDGFCFRLLGVMDQRFDERVDIGTIGFELCAQSMLGQRFRDRFIRGRDAGFQG